MVLPELAPDQLLADTIAGADIFSDIYDAVKRLVAFPLDMAGWMWDRFTEVYNAAYTAGDRVYDWVWQAAHDAERVVNDSASWVVDTVNNAAGWVAGQASDLATWTVNTVNAAASYVAGRVADLASWTVDAVNNAAGWVAGRASDLAGWTVDQVNAAAGWLAQQLSNLAAFVGAGFGSLQGYIGDASTWLLSQIESNLKNVESTVTDARQFLTESVVNNIVQGAADLGGFFLDGLKWFVEQAFDPIADALAVKLSMPRKFLTGQYRNIEEIITDFEDPIEPGSLAGVLFSIAAVLPTLASLAVGLGPIYSADTLQQVNQLVGPTLPSLVDTRDAYLRGVIDEGQHDEILGRLGYSSGRISILKQLYFDVPPPSDLVRMAVREAFSPDVVAKFGQDQDFPEAFAQYGRQVGIDDSWARAYWAAHWELPSPGQGFEMFHRGIIGQDDLEVLLRALDVMPFWRDRLIQMNYAVPGRIDLRRMFAAGVIDEPRLLKGYQDLGYNDADARILVEFAKKDAAGDPAQLPRGTITKAYRDQLLTRDQAAQELAALGYESADVDLFLALEDFANAQEDAALAEGIVEADFKAGLTDEGGAHAALVELGVPQARADLLVKRWRNRKAIKTVTLSAAQVQRLLREGIIDGNAALERFSALGYNDTDARFLVDIATPDPAEVNPPDLTVSQLFRAQAAGIFDEAELRNRLQHRGYTAADIDVLVALATPDAPSTEAAELTKADLILAGKKKVLSADQVGERLRAKGYVAGDVEILLAANGLTAAG